MICTPIKGPTFVDARNQIHAALQHADLVELRLDNFLNLDVIELEKLRAEFSIPMIFTLRSQQQGGSYHKPETKRLADIRDLAQLNPEYLDLENDLPSQFIHEIATTHPKIKIILSYHNFNEIPQDLDAIMDQMRKSPADYYKIAVSPINCLETIRFMVWAKKRKKLIAICMGSHGQISRILGPVIGSPFTFAAINDDQKTAPGQLSAITLIEKYHHSTLNQNTAIYGLIGDPVDKSISDITHNALISEYHLNAVYVKIQVDPKELQEFIQLAKQIPFAGLSITMPLKECVLPYLDDIGSKAKNIGAVNTLHLNNGVFKGYNTDGIGALNAIESVISVKDKRIIILGAGGATKAIAYEALHRGAKVTILNRNADKAVKIANQLGCDSKGLDAMTDCARMGYDILINCTPIEMPIDAEDILPQAIVMDIKTKPKNSELLKQAMAKGCQVIYGYQMFVEQAIGQFHLWFNGRIDADQCREFLKAKAEEYI